MRAVLAALGREAFERPIATASVVACLVGAAQATYSGDQHGAQLYVLTALVMARKD